MKLTPWFEGETKPVRVGVYQRAYSHCGAAYSKWTGSIWLWGSDRHAEADAERGESPLQSLPWRGLAEKFGGKQKPRHIEQPKDEVICPKCKGSGEGTAMTYGRGPDDYEYPCQCSNCGGDGVIPEQAKDGT